MVEEAQNHLRKDKHGTYHFRIRVPEHLKGFFTQTEITRSLRTKRLHKAKSRVGSVRDEVWKMFQDLEKQNQVEKKENVMQDKETPSFTTRRHSKRTTQKETPPAPKPKTDAWGSRMDPAKLPLMRRNTVNMCIEFMNGKPLEDLMKRYNLPRHAIRSNIKRFCWKYFPAITTALADAEEKRGVKRWASVEFFEKHRKDFLPMPPVDDFMMAPDAMDVMRVGFRKKFHAGKDVSVKSPDLPPAPPAKDAEKKPAVTVKYQQQQMPFTDKYTIKLSKIAHDMLECVAEDLKKSLDDSIRSMITEYYESRNYHVKKLDGPIPFQIVKTPPGYRNGQK